MTLERFIEDLKKEMKKNKWQNREVKFQTSNRSDLEYLSIYTDRDGDVCIDVGKEGE